MNAVRVVLVPCGSRGDVQPLISLGIELRRRGHDVVVATSPEFAEAAVPAGLAFEQVGDDTREFVESSARDCVAGPLRSWRAINRHLFRVVAAQFRDLPRVVAGADLVVGGGMQIGAPSVAESIGVPYRYVVYCPAALQSREHTPMLVPVAQLPAWANLPVWRGMRFAYGVALGPRVQRRRSQLGLGPVDNLYDSITTARPLLATDCELAPAPRDCTPRPIQVGYLHAPLGPALPPGLEQFLASGPRPVYVGFGSMTCPDPAATTRNVARAAAQLGRRLVVSRGWARLGSDIVARDVFVTDDVCHAQLFCRCAAVVHHGGAGTTAAAARAGVPQVIVPHLADQPFWGRQIAARGLGSPPLPREQLSGPRLAAALGDVLADRVMQRRAAELGARLRARNSAAAAADELLGPAVPRRRARRASAAP